MATAAISSPVVSLNNPATFPIRLGASIRKPAESKKFTSIRYNHKPRLDQAQSVQCAISTSHSPETDRRELELRLTDGDKEYAYLGKNVGDGDSYILLAKGSGKDAEMILEKLDTCHDFNLVRTPEEKSARALAERYPPLANDEDGQDDLFGDEDPTEEEPPDADNPFDYRNYLKSRLDKAKTHPTDAPRSGATTPPTQPRPTSTTPHSRPSKRPEGPLIAQKKRKAQDTAKPNPKRVKAGAAPPEPTSTAAPTRKDIPKLRMDRKASLHLPPFDDSGELIVENETPVQEKPRSAMALALTGQLGQGPISLHSAASSPASRVASPMPPRPEHFEEGEEFELGEGSSPEVPNRRRADEKGVIDDEDADADADGDVEGLELPSPAQSHRQPQGTSGDAAEDKSGADDEDDLDKQLALAMAEEDDGEALPVAVPAESDEESEEE